MITNLANLCRYTEEKILFTSLWKKWLKKWLKKLKIAKKKKTDKKHFKKPLKMSEEYKKHFKQAEECHISGRSYTEKDIRVRDHCHTVLQKNIEDLHIKIVMSITLG